MSAAKMMADSTQDASEGKKKKRKLKKSGKKVLLPEDEDSDLDLKKDLKPISYFANERSKMIEEMFHSVRGASLQRALPELLKSIPLEELKLLCLEQLEVMSKKRIRRILAGEESTNISSSGTDDESSEEENHDIDSKSHASDIADIKEEEGPMADSTSINQESSLKCETEKEQVQEASRELSQPPSTADSFHDTDIDIKQEPPDSEPEDEEDYESENQDEDEIGPEEEEEEEDDDDDVEEYDPPEAYTSGSEDGELVKKETVKVSIAPTLIKQEVFSDSENQDQRQDESESDLNNSQNVKVLEGELLSSAETNVGETGNPALPSTSNMMDQMELLELEMRARAIKAMLTSAQEEEPDDG